MTFCCKIYIYINKAVISNFILALDKKYLFSFILTKLTSFKTNSNRFFMQIYSLFFYYENDFQKQIHNNFEDVASLLQTTTVSQNTF